MGHAGVSYSPPPGPYLSIIAAWCDHLSPPLELASHARLAVAAR
jgi:hypothetical protein